MSEAMTEAMARILARLLAVRRPFGITIEDAVAPGCDQAIKISIELQGGRDWHRVWPILSDVPLEIQVKRWLHEAEADLVRVGVD